MNDATHERIDMLLKQLGLSSQADTIVGDIFLKGLSGGQKRRLSIALEALSEPSTFILDECTSGLGKFRLLVHGGVFMLRPIRYCQLTHPLLPRHDTTKTIHWNEYYQSN